MNQLIQRYTEQAKGRAQHFRILRSITSLVMSWTRFFRCLLFWWVHHCRHEKLFCCNKILLLLAHNLWKSSLGKDVYRVTQQIFRIKWARENKTCWHQSCKDSNFLMAQRDTRWNNLFLYCGCWFSTNSNTRLPLRDSKKSCKAFLILSITNSVLNIKV